ncbi:hypothetical protein PGIGA_G00045690 [Pangasianodon gigas]|uniref:Uncharacterized protein n=1 Tax=Pangasianodon gigas TaxID=30993 RepID=A0ACC5X152_PANGG|nr:hypothetical protein [Pangasianodon gigas]
MECEEKAATQEHDYCRAPTASALTDDQTNENDALERKLQELEAKLETVHFQAAFTASDEDIKFHTRVTVSPDISWEPTLDGIQLAKTMVQIEAASMTDVTSSADRLLLQMMLN